ncbi:MAG: hypothetical protein IIA67_00225, partial [Planctomycetes bacterium]|nr:hypothetical protein [Planctomycetota bacterium]
MIGQRAGTILDLGTNILCGDPLFVDPAGDFHLLPGSPAIGAGTHGLDLGAFVPAGATLSEWSTLTARNFATFTVDGPGIVEYRFRLDGGPWSDAASVDEPIELTDLADSSHRIEVIGKNTPASGRTKQMRSCEPGRSIRRSRTWWPRTMISRPKKTPSWWSTWPAVSWPT